MRCDADEELFLVQQHLYSLPWKGKSGRWGGEYGDGGVVERRMEKGKRGETEGGLILSHFPF